jgi:hypothetical protein
MASGGRILIIERLIPEDGSDPVPTLLSDINMPRARSVGPPAGLHLSLVLGVATERQQL